MVGWGERTRLIEISMWYSAGNRMKEGAAVGEGPQGQWKVRRERRETWKGHEEG